MQTLETKNKVYPLDDDGFLINPEQWDRDFAEAMAPSLGVPSLTPSHWNVLNFIRSTYLQTESVPIVHKTCKTHNLKIKQLERLFPSGYQRGACKLAGVPSLHEGVCSRSEAKGQEPIGGVPVHQRIYRVNVQGFLIDSNEWDEDFAACKAHELQIPGHLSEKHWQIIRYLRSEYEKTGEIPTIYRTCETTGIDIDELADLFPTGYHRGAAKIAGLHDGKIPEATIAAGKH